MIVVQDARYERVLYHDHGNDGADAAGALPRLAWRRHLADVELRVRTLPEQETREPLFPGCAYHEIGIGLTARVQVIRDVLDVEDLGELLDARALARMVLQQRSDGVSD